MINLRNKRKSSTPTPHSSKLQRRKNGGGDTQNDEKKEMIKKKRKKLNSRTVSLKFRGKKNESTNRENSSSSKTVKKKSSKKKRSNRDVSLTQKFDRYGLGNCFSTSISLPKWPWLQSRFKECSVPINERGKYCIIVRSGGTYTFDENVSQENDIIIFNSKHLYHTHSHKPKKRMVVEINHHDNMEENESSSKKKSSRKKTKNKNKNKERPKSKSKSKKKSSSKRKIRKRNKNIEIVKYAKPKIINGYYSRLPSFRKETEYLSVTYNEYNSSLYCFGGLNLGRSLKSILQLKLDCKYYKNIRWKKCGALKKSRYSCSLVSNGYYSNNITVIGGINNNGREMRSVEMYKILNRDSVLLSPLNEARANAGCCYIRDTNQIIVGGGVKYGDSSKQIELYNFDKNIWSIHSATTNYKHSFPTIWNDQINPNIIYIGGDNIGISGGGRNANLGYIEWIDLRDSTTKNFHVLYEEPIDRLWRFRLLSRHNGWESRALFCM